MERAKIYPLNRNRFAISAPDNAPALPPKPKLLDQVCQAIRARHYSDRTNKAYVHWIKRYIFFHDNAIRWKWPSLKSVDFFRVWLRKDT